MKRDKRHDYEMVIISRARRHRGMLAMTHIYVVINLINIIVDYYSSARLRLYNHYTRLEDANSDTRTERERI